MTEIDLEQTLLEENPFMSWEKDSVCFRGLRKRRGRGGVLLEKSRKKGFLRRKQHV